MATGDQRPARYNVKMWKGNTWLNTFTILKDNVPVNLSSAEVRIQIRRKPTSTTAEVTITEADGITVGGASDNVITVSKRINIAAAEYYWDLLVINGGVYTTYLWGTFLIDEDITEAA
jgi:hypothetical protein